MIDWMIYDLHTENVALIKGMIQSRKLLATVIQDLKQYKNIFHMHI